MMGEEYKVDENECVTDANEERRKRQVLLFLPRLCECGSTLQRTSILGDERRRMPNVVPLSSLRPL